MSKYDICICYEPGNTNSNTKEEQSDSGEGKIAKKFQEFLTQYLIKNNLNSAVSVKLIDEGELDRCKIVIFLCSPYSIAKPTIHNECGALYSINEKRRKLGESIKILPICHSGLTANELPLYLATSQGLTISSEEGTGVSKKPKDKDQSKKQDDNIKRLNKFGELLLDDICQIQEDLQYAAYNKDFSELWEDCWKEKGSSTNKQSDNSKSEDESTPKETNKINFVEVNLTKSERDNINAKNILTLQISENSIAPLTADNEDRKKWHLRISKAREFLVDDSCTKYTGSISIGLQPMLWDGKNLHIGLQSIKSLNRKETCYYYHSGTQPITESNIDVANSVAEIKPPDEIIHVNIDEKKEIKDYLERRLQSMNARLWKVKLKGDYEQYAIITLNDSDKYPRLEIGTVQILDFSEDKFNLTSREELLDGGFLDSYLKNNWVWAKDGKIAYWFFLKTEDHRIERMVYRNAIENSILTNAKTMLKEFGCCRVTTTHASDEERSTHEPLVMEPFTISARTLLTIF